MYPFLLLLVALILVGCLPAGSEDAQKNERTPLESALASPSATGLLIHTVAEGGQAAAKGFAKGDILVSYAAAPTPDDAALDAAKERVEQEKAESVQVEIVRGGKKLTFTLKPGPIGVMAVAVEKGKKVETRPPATDFAFDFSRLKDGPIEDWQSFYIRGKKVGFEHNVLAMQDGKLVLDSEVAFDFGNGGIQHFVVRVVASSGSKPRPISCRFETPLHPFVCKGHSKAGRWDSTLSWPEEENGKTVQKSETVSIEMPPDIMPSYLLRYLCAFMPRTAGACFHYTLLSEGSGRLYQAEALFAARLETIDVEGETIEAWRYEYRSMGGTGNISWIDSEGRVVKNFYGGGTESFLTTRENALAGLNPQIKPRTDK